MSFSNGLASVARGLGKESNYGFIDQSGKIVLNFIFSRAKSFKNELAFVRIGDYKTGVEGYINKKGKFIWKKK